MAHANQKIIYENSTSMNKKQYYSYQHKNNSSPLSSVHNLLSNLTLSSWTSFLSQNFSRAPNTIRYLQLENSYLNVSIMNYYRIRYSKLSHLIYEDMKEFDKMLAKFNFLRFFMTSGSDNVIRAQKNC